MIDVFVPGHPAPQGSKNPKGRTRNGHVILVESSKYVKPWRESIRFALLDERLRPKAYFEAAVISLEFILPRPKSTPKRRTPLATKKPDLDKLVRSVFDAVTSAGVVTDDSNIVGMKDVNKRLAEIGEAPGLRLRLEEAV